MHRHFSDWYREADINPEPETLKHRFQGIETIVGSIDAKEVLELVRLLFSLPLRDKTFNEKFTEAFRSADATFPMRNNQKELSVLAGATIAKMLDEVNKWDNLAALTTLCASFLPYRSGPPLNDIIFEAREYLLSSSARLRTNLEFSSIELPSLKIKNLKNTLNQHLESCDPNNLQQKTLIEPLVNYIIQTAATVSEFMKSTSIAADSNCKSFNLLSEELNILWWVFGEFSKDLEQRMSDVPFPAACLVAGKELADLVITLPGPLAPKAFLSKMIGAGRTDQPSKIQLKDAINQLPKQFREKWIKEKDIDITQSICPVHLGANFSLSTDGDDDWWPPYRKMTGIDISHEVNPSDLSFQVYRESLLLGKFKI